jgi:hypothetical protein
MNPAPPVTKRIFPINISLPVKIRHLLDSSLISFFRILKVIMIEFEPWAIGLQKFPEEFLNYSGQFFSRITEQQQIRGG